jgi:hypothetical protein
MIFVVAIVIMIPMPTLMVPVGFRCPVLRPLRGSAIRGRQLDKLFQFAAVKPHPLAIRTDVHLHAASLDGSQCCVAYRAFHNISLLV